MSDGYKHKIEDYLQFTPLSSAVSIRPLIESFITPEVLETNPPINDNLSSIGSPQEQGRLLNHVLRRANDLRGTLSFRHFLPTQDYSPYASANLGPALLETLATYRAGSSQDLVSAGVLDESSDLKPSDSSKSRDLEDNVVALLPTHASVTPNEKHRMTFAVEVTTPVSRSKISSDLHSPSKRELSSSTLLETPTKNKKHKKNSHQTPPKLEPERDTTKLLVDLKTEQATVTEQVVSFVEEIFENEDNLEADTSATSGSNGRQAQLFECATTNKILSLAATKKLLALVRRSGQLNMTSTLNRDYLLRLQQILLRAINSTSNMKVQPLEIPLMEAIGSSEWAAAIDGVTNALYSSLCVCFILNSTVDMKEFYAEETLMAIVDNLKYVIEDLILKWFLDSCAGKGLVDPEHGDSIDPLLQTVIALMTRLTSLFATLPLTESISSRMIFLSTGIVFAEVPGKNNDVCSNQLIESFKLRAVSCLQCIYATTPLQRQFMLDEVLSSLSKLPANRQGARQFKLTEGKSIRLVTALLLYLVQSSTLVTIATDDPPWQKGVLGLPQGLDERPENVSSGVPDVPAIGEGSNGLQRHTDRIVSANQTARYIINFLLDRAMKTLKSSNAEEAPFKELVDGFVEDFVLVLPYPEWPAAELMLKWIANSMLRLVDNPKQGAHVKVSAVDTLCNIGCMIKATTIAINHPIPIAGDQIQQSLLRLPKFDLNETTTSAQLRDLQELQTLVFQYLAKCACEDETYRASLEFCISNHIMFLYKRSEDPGIKDNIFRDALQAIAQQISDIHELKDDALWRTGFVLPIPDAVISQVYLHGLSFSSFLQMFDSILSRLLIMMDHAQTTLRTKTLRSFGRLSEVDPSILSGRTVQNQIAQRVSDSSPQVRDVAIDLLGKYISANPLAGSDYYGVLRDRIVDTGLGVRKRVIKLCRDLYIGEKNNPVMRADIAAQLLQRLHDEEDSVQELATKTIESLWFNNLELDNLVDHKPLSSLSPTVRKDINSRAEILSILAIDKHESVPETLIEFLTNTVEKATEAKANIERILGLVAQSFLEDVTIGTDDSKRLKAIIAIKVLAEGAPNAFTSSQMEVLLPYLQYGTTTFEQNAPFHVASTYRSILPTLNSQNATFLGEVQSTILAQLTKLPLRSLNEVVPALCSVVRITGDFTRVTKTIKSCLTRMRALTVDIAVPSVSRDKQIVLLLHLVGLFGRYLSIKDEATLKQTFEVSDASEVTNMLTVTILPMVPDINATLTTIGKAALQSLGNVAINNPAIFQDSRVLKITDGIMYGNQVEAKRILLGIYSEFLRIEQKSTDALTKLQEGVPITKGRASGKKVKKVGSAQVDVGVLTGNTDKFVTDGISPSIMQRYLKQILAASLGVDAQLAVVATHLISSIVVQGLANPRNCMPTIIALETSSDAHLRGVASTLHRNLNEKHESLIESCYIDGVKLAYRYQMRMNGNKLQLPPNISSIHTLYDIAKGSRKGRQKFLAALTRGLDLNIDKLERLMETDVKYAQFTAHNLACLRYATNEEIHIVIHAVDKIMSTTGTALQHLLETQSGLAQYGEDELGKASAVLAYGMSLRGQLKLVYNISDAKCLAFEPTRLGSRSDAKAAVKQPGIALLPDWSAINAPATTRQRIQCVTELFTREEHFFQQNESIDGPDEDQPMIEDADTIDMARLPSLQ